MERLSLEALTPSPSPEDGRGVKDNDYFWICEEKNGRGVSCTKRDHLLNISQLTSLHLKADRFFAESSHTKPSLQPKQLHHPSSSLSI